ncbi:MAG: FHIPEP family type III secretion protein [Planctomycetales bacterium]|nr:FHIPEP family type III secretion protein [Planctomycetales bacterium]
MATETNNENRDSNFSFAQRSELVLSLGLLGVLVVLLIPLPPFLLDMMLTLNLGLTVTLLLITMSVTRPLDISVFPTLLLLLTLGRLSLNVATTRLILLNGNAGRLVDAFGGFVVGGNLVVGLVIFLILIIIQFVVITKGAGRISEVAARFVLDSLPGKQLAIDAELGTGSINEKVARERRNALAREAEFYGAMDGATKFVRGDAIAGLIVTAVNLIGGIILGTSNGISMAEAATRYSILTVGDGLISQIPALIVALSAGVLVTKSGSQIALGQEIGTQMMSNRRPLMTAAGIFVLMSFTPGLPKIPFLILAGGLLLIARLPQITEEEPTEPQAEVVEAPKASPEEQVLEEFLQVDRSCVELGARLLPLVESKRGKGLAERIPDVRRELSQKFGLWVPAVRIRDNLDLDSDGYRILINGRQVASGTLRPDLLMAIDPGGSHLEIAGEKTQDPTFGLNARWIQVGDRQRAEMAGYTVVDPATVLSTHLGEVLRQYAYELLSRDDLHKLIQKLKEVSPSLVDEMKPEVLRVSLLHQVLIRLLEERVPISDLGRIVESLLNHAVTNKDPVTLVELVRKDIGRTICDRFRNDDGHVCMIVFEPRLEAQLRSTIHEDKLALMPSALDKLLAALHSEWQKSQLEGQEIAVLCESRLRRPLRMTIQRNLPDLAVLAFSEIPPDVLISWRRMFELEEVFAENSSQPSVSLSSVIPTAAA